MSDFLKRAAVRHLKPRLSPAQWDRLRGHQEPPPPPSLTQIAKRTGTDKWGVHFYTPHYEAHLGHLRDEEFVLLEIGVGGYARDQQGGASLRMWRRYFRNAQVVGLDIEDKSFVDRPRITTVQADQTDPDALRDVLERFGTPRVVIDDGSHRPDDIIATFGILFPLLPDGAIYAIEDTQTSYWPEFGGQEDPSAPGTTMAFVKALVDGLNHEEFVDLSYEPTYTDRHVKAVHCYHNLVVIEKGDNTEGTNKRAVLKKRYRKRPASNQRPAEGRTEGQAEDRPASGS
jgi:demethylmacrocin O-methyltransferase